MDNAKHILDWQGPTHNSDGQECVNHYHHRHALLRRYTSPHGRGLRAMLEGWARYADAHEDACGDTIGQDGVLGQQWEAIGRALNRLLDGELGGFDGGSLHQNITRTLEANGCTLY